MNSISLIIFTIGLFLVLLGYFQLKTETAAKSKIEYRYIPRNLLDEQFDETRAGKVNYLFRDMLQQECPSTWGNLHLMSDCLTKENQNNQNNQNDDSLVFKNALLVDNI